MIKMPGYPSWFATLLLTVGFIVLLSGIILIPSFLLFSLDWDVDFYLAGDSRQLLALLHFAIAIIFLMLVGSLTSIHMRSGWKRKQNVKSGVVTLIFLSLVSLSGIGTLYIGDPDSLTMNNIIHVVTGLIISCLIIFHTLIGRKISR